MHRSRRAAVLTAVALICSALPAAAQGPRPTRADSLRQAVTRLNARLDTLEAGRCPAARPVALPRPSGRDAQADTLTDALRRLDARVETLRQQRCTPSALAQAPTAASTAAPSVDTTLAPKPDTAQAFDTNRAQAADTAGGDLAALRAAAAAAAGGAGVPAIAEPTDTTAQAPQFIGKQRNASALNPEISATGDFRFAAQDPVAPGGATTSSNLREVEVALQSALDPYSSTKIFVSLENGEIDVEEGYLYWTALPGRLRLDGGKFRQQIGDLNRWHLHALPETEYPLVYRRFFGEDGLSGVGISAYTALPVSLFGGTHELWLQGTTTGSDPLYGGNRPQLLGRLQNFWQLSRSTYGQIGVTALGGNHADSALKSRVVGLDARLTWRPPEMGTRREVTLRAEGYRLHATELGTTSDRYGAFVDLAAKLTQRWTVGGRYDWTEAPRGLEDTQWAVTPAITWWQSEFVYLRLQGELLHDQFTGSDKRLTLQAVWAMGPHKHETY